MTYLASISLVKAAEVPQNVKRIGVVIIGDSDFKTSECYRFVRNKLNPNKNPNVIIESSNEVQSKYMEYWSNKGFLEEQELTEEDMIGFTKMSGYDNVIYLIPINFSAENSFIPSKSLLSFLFFGSGVESTNLSIEFAAVLCDDHNIIKKYNTTEQLGNFPDSGSTPNNSQLKYDIFRQCVRNLGKELNF